jgi:hypothetical protein
VLVPKKGKPRFAIDYRVSNQVFRDHDTHYPITLVDSCVDVMKGNVYLTVIDVLSASGKGVYSIIIRGDLSLRTLGAGKGSRKCAKPAKHHHEDTNFCLHHKGSFKVHSFVLFSVFHHQVYWQMQDEVIGDKGSYSKKRGSFSGSSDVPNQRVKIWVCRYAFFGGGCF